jgi:hypothetical protein
MGRTKVLLPAATPSRPPVASQPRSSARFSSSTVPTPLLHRSVMFLSCSSDTTSSSERRQHHTLRNTLLRWVPAVAHVCRHWCAVALDHPCLWSRIMLRLGRECASRMLTLSKPSSITATLTDPDPYEASIPLDPWATATLPPFPSPSPRRPQLDPVDVLAQHLFHIQDLDQNACSCTILPWVRILETAAPLLEAFCLRVDAHRPGT